MKASKNLVFSFFIVIFVSRNKKRYESNIFTQRKEVHLQGGW